VSCRCSRMKGTNCRGVAQPGRAPGSGPGGRRFKSSLPDQSFQALKLRFWFFRLHRCRRICRKLCPGLACTACSCRSGVPRCRRQRRTWRGRATSQKAREVAHPARAGLFYGVGFLWRRVFADFGQSVPRGTLYCLYCTYVCRCCTYVYIHIFSN
jgi:hypothetical protein